MSGNYWQNTGFSAALPATSLPESRVFEVDQKAVQSSGRLCHFVSFCVVLCHLSAKAKNSSFQWRGGDWTTKYAPWARGAGVEGPRRSAFNSDAKNRPKILKHLGNIWFEYV